MAKKSKTTVKSGSIPMALLTGLGVSLAVTLLGAAITAWAITAEWIGENNVGIGAWITVFVSAALGAWITSKKAGKKKLQLCMLTGGIYFLLLLSITAMFFDGQYSSLLTGGIIILAGSAAASLMGMKRENSGKRKTWKKAYR